MNRAQVEDRAGLARGSLSKVAKPPVAVVIGPINPDGSIPRGTVVGYDPDDVEKWVRERSRQRGRPKKKTNTLP
ncbi:hypothetical protein [Gordonia malaquae]|uniref:hypothetical protein n=1 Tax=Gordonia malaquae TaxID=410332 RepID=UPI00301B37E5